MKSIHLFLVSALALIGTAAARPPVTIYGKAYYDDNRFVLRIFADSAVPLRTFGIRLGFNPKDLGKPEVFSNDALWFISARVGQRSAYSPTQAPNPETLRVIGARFQGDDRKHGVTGPDLLLATMTFVRSSTSLPSFQVALAGPTKYASFVTVDSITVDPDVDGLGTLALSIYPLPQDTDRDGIPDPVELAWFGNLTRANATSDSDGDGSTDVDEWIGGTHAGDPNSVTRLLLQMQPDGSRLLIWNGQNGRVYDVLKSTGVDPFTPIAEGRTVTPTDTMLDKVPLDRGFYRLRIRFPAAGY